LQPGGLDGKRGSGVAFAGDKALKREGLIASLFHGINILVSRVIKRLNNSTHNRSTLGYSGTA